MNQYSSLQKFALSLIGILIVVVAIQIAVEKSKLAPAPVPFIDMAAAKARQKSYDLFIRPDSHKQGSVEAKVTLVLFGDHQSPASLAAHEIVKKILDEYGKDIYFVYHHFPLKTNNYARVAAEATEAAGFSGKFWEMNELLYKNQAVWIKAKNLTTILDTFSGYAETIGLDPVVFRKELVSGKYTYLVNNDKKDAAAFDVENAPALFINGVRFSDQLTYANVKEVIENELK